MHQKTGLLRQPDPKILQSVYTRPSFPHAREVGSGHETNTDTHTHSHTHSHTNIGTTYIIWGSNICTSTGSSAVYDGIINVSFLEPLCRTEEDPSRSNSTCALCYLENSATVITIYDSLECPPSWNLEYSGSVVNLENLNVLCYKFANQDQLSAIGGIVTPFECAVCSR